MHGFRQMDLLVVGALFSGHFVAPKLARALDLASRQDSESWLPRNGWKSHICRSVRRRRRDLQWNPGCFRPGDTAEPR